MLKRAMARLRKYLKRRKVDVKPLSRPVFRQKFMRLSLQWVGFGVVPTLLMLYWSEQLKSESLLLVAFTYLFAAGVCMEKLYSRLMRARLLNIYPSLHQAKNRRAHGWLLGSLFVSPVVYIVSCLFFWNKRTEEKSAPIGWVFRRPVLSGVLALFIGFGFLPLAILAGLSRLNPTAEKVATFAGPPIFAISSHVFVRAPSISTLVTEVKGAGATMLSGVDYKRNPQDLSTRVAIEAFVRKYENEKQLDYIPLSSKILAPAVYVGVHRLEQFRAPAGDFSNDRRDIAIAESFVAHLEFLGSTRFGTENIRTNHVSLLNPSSALIGAGMAYILHIADRHFSSEFQQRTRALVAKLELRAPDTESAEKLEVLKLRLATLNSNPSVLTLSE